ncbi:MAG: HXXEE domain-containing protein [Actinomycetota bacterium]|nr:HXXEE domain-containing protein [Actinomycetota bacterium]
MSTVEQAAQAIEVSGRAKQERLSAYGVGVVVVGFSAWVLTTLPIQAAAILTVASVLAFLGWVFTTYAYPVRSRKAIATYLAAVSFQLIHMAEEYTGGFPHEIVDLFDSPRDWTEQSFLLTFVFGFGSLWCLAGAGALYQIRVANFMLWFYALGAGLINAISHFIFPIIKGGYFPGLYTAAGHLVLSGLLITVLIQESRRLKSEAKEIS